jgi:hypothetical protein
VERCRDTRGNDVARHHKGAPGPNRTKGTKAPERVHARRSDVQPGIVSAIRFPIGAVKGTL